MTVSPTARLHPACAYLSPVPAYCAPGTLGMVSFATPEQVAAYSCTPYGESLLQL